VIFFLITKSFYKLNPLKKRNSTFIRQTPKGSLSLEFYKNDIQLIMEVLTDIFRFLLERKKFWLLPIILVLLLLGALLIFGAESSLGPFIYTLF